MSDTGFTDYYADFCVTMNRKKTVKQLQTSLSSLSLVHHYTKWNITPLTDLLGLAESLQEKDCIVLYVSLF